MHFCDEKPADVCRWLVSLDDVDGPGADDRRTVTLNQIINRARKALNTEEATTDGEARTEA